MISIKKMGFLVLFGLASTGVFAGDEGNFYAGADINRTRSDDICVKGLSCNQTDYKWGVFGGYNFNATFAAELGYNDLGSYSVGPFNGDADDWEVAGLARYPVFDGAWSLYARAGWAYYNVNTNIPGGDSNGSDWLYGVGADIPAGDKINVRIDWREYNNVGSGASESDVSVWSLGGVYNF